MRDFGDGIGLRVPDFEDRDGIAIHELAHLRDQHAIVVKPVLSREQGACRFVVAHIGIERRVVLDIGGVAQDQVESAKVIGPAFLSPVAFEKACLRPDQTMRLCIGLRHPERSWRRVDADPRRPGQFNERGHEQGA